MSPDNDQREKEPPYTEVSRDNEQKGKECPFMEISAPLTKTMGI